LLDLGFGLRLGSGLPCRLWRLGCLLRLGKHDSTGRAPASGQQSLPPRRHECRGRQPRCRLPEPSPSATPTGRIALHFLQVPRSDPHAQRARPTASDPLWWIARLFSLLRGSADVKRPSGWPREAEIWSAVGNVAPTPQAGERTPPRSTRRARAPPPRRPAR
jgi:hypothetical protein